MILQLLCGPKTEETDRPIDADTTPRSSGPEIKPIEKVRALEQWIGGAPNHHATRDFKAELQDMTLHADATIRSAAGAAIERLVRTH